MTVAFSSLQTILFVSTPIAMLAIISLSSTAVDAFSPFVQHKTQRHVETMSTPFKSSSNFIFPFIHVNALSNTAAAGYWPVESEEQQEVRRADEIRQEWIAHSVQYYSKVMREERRRSAGQFKEVSDPQYYKVLAKKHYFALRKIKDGKPHHAESIYRRIINELIDEQATDGENCDHSKLAVTTLLLALHLQRNNESPKKTRSVFLNFFRLVTAAGEHEECACSAKVLQAFALFEMKQGNKLKSVEVAMAAIKLDPTLKGVLNWKQFRDAIQRKQQRPSPITTNSYEGLRP